MKTPKGEEGAHTISQVYYTYFYVSLLERCPHYRVSLGISFTAVGPPQEQFFNPPLIFNTLFRPTIPLRGVYTHIYIYTYPGQQQEARQWS